MPPTFGWVINISAPEKPCIGWYHYFFYFMGDDGTRIARMGEVDELDDLAGPQEATAVGPAPTLEDAPEHASERFSSRVQDVIGQIQDHANEATERRMEERGLAIAATMHGCEELKLDIAKLSASLERDQEKLLKLTRVITQGAHSPSPDGKLQGQAGEIQAGLIQRVSSQQEELMSKIQALAELQKSDDYMLGSLMKQSELPFLERAKVAEAQLSRMRAAVSHKFLEPLRPTMDSIKETNLVLEGHRQKLEAWLTENSGDNKPWSFAVNIRNQLEGATSSQDLDRRLSVLANSLDQWYWKDKAEKSLLKHLKEQDDFHKYRLTLDALCGLKKTLMSISAEVAEKFMVCLAVMDLE